MAEQGTTSDGTNYVGRVVTIRAAWRRLGGVAVADVGRFAFLPLVWCVVVFVARAGTTA